MSFATPLSQQAAPRARPSLWALVLAILLGAAAALLAPFGHAHGEGGVFLHSHAFAGPHSHGPAAAGEPLPGEDAEEDSRVLVLAFAARLDGGAPVLGRAEAATRLAGLLGPLPPPAAGHAAPWSPRGPPHFPC